VLDRAREDAEAGQARFVVVAGEPGIGKTTLAEEAASRAEAAGAAVAWGRCHDDEGALPLWPWAQVVRAVTTPADVPELRRPVLAALLPELGDPMADPQLDADAARFRLYDAVRASLERAAAARPVVVVLDDLQ
jgi:predicted ATPase